jgi:hypothetical protein
MGPTALLPLRRKCVIGIFITRKNPPSSVLWSLAGGKIGQVLRIPSSRKGKQPTGSVQYLWAVLHANLSWKQHVKQKTGKVCSSFWLCRQTICRNWGTEQRKLCFAQVHWACSYVCGNFVVFKSVWPESGLNVVTCLCRYHWVCKNCPYICSQGSALSVPEPGGRENGQGLSLQA